MIRSCKKLKLIIWIILPKNSNIWKGKGFTGDELTNNRILSKFQGCGLKKDKILATEKMEKMKRNDWKERDKFNFFLWRR